MKFCSNVWPIALAANRSTANPHFAISLWRNLSPQKPHSLTGVVALPMISNVATFKKAFDAEPMFCQLAVIDF